MLAISPQLFLTFTIQKGTDVRFRFLSTDGKCYPFDERVSGGFGPGEGASCVILKPLQDAVDAGDNIRSVIRGTGINSDGRTPGISLPSSEAQAKLIRSVYSSAGLEPSDTKVIEAHGTGTTVGDPIEASAFAATIAKGATAQDPVYIGSSKSNFGHLEGVSGIVSLIKGVMMLAKQTILPSANFKASNPKITSLGTQLQVRVQMPCILMIQHITILESNTGVICLKLMRFRCLKRLYSGGVKACGEYRSITLGLVALMPMR